MKKLLTLILFLVILLALPVGVEANDFTGKAQALWNFDSGALITDSIGAYTLTSNASPTEDTVNQQQGDACVDLEDDDASLDYYSRAGATSDFNWDSSNLLTVGGWVYPRETGVTQPIFKKAASGKMDFGVLINTADKVAFMIGHTNGDNTEFEAASTALPALNEWYHITVSYNGSGGAVEGLADKEGRIYIYRLSTTTVILNETPATAADKTWGEDGIIYIGKSAADYFDGILDEMFVDDSIYTTTEIDEVIAETLGNSSSPTIPTNIGIITDPFGTPSYNSNQTIIYSTDGTLFYVGGPLTEQLTISDPNLSTLTLSPDYGSIVGGAVGQVLISGTYYLCYEFKTGYTWNYTTQTRNLATGHRSADLQTAAVGSAIALNGTVMRDGDGNNLDTTLPSTDIGDVTLASPKTANSPFEVKPSGGHATTLANLETAVGASGLFTTDVVILSGVTEATATATAAALYYIYSLTGDFDCDSLACTVRGTNRVSGSVLNSGSATLHAYNPPRVSN